MSTMAARAAATTATTNVFLYPVFINTPTRKAETTKKEQTPEKETKTFWFLSRQPAASQPVNQKMTAAGPSPQHLIPNIKHPFYSFFIGLCYLHPSL
jgi:hypothetical protein